MSPRQSPIESACSAVAIACLAIVVGAAGGHVVPPEKLHQVAESYRRATFILNLNPVNWEQVSLDVAAIADYRRGSDPEAAQKFKADARRLITRATTSICPVGSGLVGLTPAHVTTPACSTTYECSTMYYRLMILHSL